MRDLSIAYGNSRSSKKWINKDIRFEDLCERLKNTTRTTESAEEYKKMNKADRDAAKDKGGFVGGKLRGGERKIESVLSRSMLTLDIDHAEANFLEKFSEKNIYTCCIYSTHSHTPEAPRLRLIVPLTRDVTPEEYTAIARFYAKEFGIDQFDECSYKANQLMYWPTTPANGEYVFRVMESKWLNPDNFLQSYPEWKDCFLLPTSSRESEAKDYKSKKQEDPLSKGGVVGAFCRVYGIADVMGEFLTGIYEETQIPNRYHYIPADSMPGVQVFEDKWVYSNHASDPAYGKLLNAFDLVRVHKFGDTDEKKSFKEMCEFASSDEKVGLELDRVKKEEAANDFIDDENWASKLERDKAGKCMNTLHNVRLILSNDPNLKGIVVNQLADAMEVIGDAPWSRDTKFWRDADDAQLMCYLDANYGSFSQRNYELGISKVADDRRYHPIKNFLENLPAWDGVKRVETSLIDYFGADDNEYVRAVTRKTFCAAVRRIYEPGVKFDYILVMNGPQGIGKSTFISKLGKEWYSDSLNLSDMNDKTAAEKLQGYWILEIGELAGMKKADIDKVKAFISRQDDKYRVAFGRRVTPHLRQCIFFGTTNADTGYLRDVTGNRRFWSVKTPGTGKKKPWELKEDEVLQMWAETMEIFKDEPLHLEKHLEDFAEKEQSLAMEQDDREGLVLKYLDTLLPDSWDAMDLFQRREYLDDPDGSMQPAGKHKRKMVCNLEIWCECFGKSKEDIKPSDSYAIKAIMARIGSWKKKEKQEYISLYGKQRVYERTTSGTTGTT